MSKLTNEQKGLLLKMIKDNTLCIRELSGHFIHEPRFQNHKYSISFMKLFYQLSDSIHNMPNAIHSNNLEKAIDGLFIYLDIEKLIKNNLLYNTLMGDYQCNRRKVIKLLHKEGYNVQ